MRIVESIVCQDDSEQGHIRIKWSTNLSNRRPRNPHPFVTLKLGEPESSVPGLLSVVEPEPLLHPATKEAPKMTIALKRRSVLEVMK